MSMRSTQFSACYDLQCVVSVAYACAHVCPCLCDPRCQTTGSFSSARTQAGPDILPTPEEVSAVCAVPSQASALAEFALQQLQVQGEVALLSV